MEVVQFIGNLCDEWNAFASREPSFSLLQSWEWGEFKEKLGWKVFRIAVQDQGQIIAGAQMLIKPMIANFISVAYIPRGPIGNWQDKRITPLLFSELRRVASVHKAIFLKIEPPQLYDPFIDQMLQVNQFHPSIHTNQPRATIIINLDTSLDEIFQQFRPTTKQRIKCSAEKGVVIRVGGIDDFPSFYEMMRITGKREGFPSRTRNYYENEWLSFAGNKHCVLLMATYQDELLAVHMGYRFSNHAAFFHGGSKFDSAKLHPNHLLVWEGVKWAKEQGCKTYDLWGIPAEVGQIVSQGNVPPKSDRTDGLWGVYQFKRGFSKNIVYYMGAYDYALNPLIYKMITSKLLNIDAMDRFSVMIDTFARI